MHVLVFLFLLWRLSCLLLSCSFLLHGQVILDFCSEISRYFVVPLTLGILFVANVKAIETVIIIQAIVEYIFIPS